MTLHSALVRDGGLPQNGVKSLSLAKLDSWDNLQHFSRLL